MQLNTFFFQADRGWSLEPLPELDSDHTLVIAFGCSPDPAIAGAIDELSSRYPRATLMGCSTAGEIFQTRLLDQSLTVAVLRFEHSRPRQAVVPVGAQHDSFAAGRDIARQLLD